jgi:rhodanese-related sulfurtransferase
VTAKRGAALLAAVSAFGLSATWGLAAGRRATAVDNRAEQALVKRDVFVSPAEVATLMHNRGVALAIFDLRDEPAFNQFHLVDAKRGVVADTIRALPDKTVKLVVGDDEESEARAFRRLAHQGIKQVYLLAGGVPAWLALFAPPETGGALLPGALGGRHPASYPEIAHTVLPKFEPKVKLGGNGAKKGPGGCGG